jgi:hypothetical protein
MSSRPNHLTAARPDRAGDIVAVDDACHLKKVLRFIAAPLVAAAIEGGDELVIVGGKNAGFGERRIPGSSNPCKAFAIAIASSDLAFAAASVQVKLELGARGRRPAGALFDQIRQTLRRAGRPAAPSTIPSPRRRSELPAAGPRHRDTRPETRPSASGLRRRTGARIPPLFVPVLQ